MNQSTLSFTINPNVRSVVLMDKDGAENKYELREMSAADRDRYLDRLSLRMRLDTTGKPIGVAKFTGMHSELLTLCLIDMKADKPVADATVQGWPASITLSLFEEAQKINKLRDDAPPEGKEKNG